MPQAIASHPATQPVVRSSLHFNTEAVAPGDVKSLGLFKGDCDTCVSNLPLFLLLTGGCPVKNCLMKWH